MGLCLRLLASHLAGLDLQVAGWLPREQPGSIQATQRGLGETLHTFRVLELLVAFHRPYSLLVHHFMLIRIGVASADNLLMCDN